MDNINHTIEHKKGQHLLKLILKVSMRHTWRNAVDPLPSGLRPSVHSSTAFRYCLLYFCFL